MRGLERLGERTATHETTNLQPYRLDTSVPYMYIYFNHTCAGAVTTEAPVEGKGGQTDFLGLENCPENSTPVDQNRLVDT